MNTAFSQAFSELEKQREDLLQSVRHLSDEAFNQPPEPGKWSVAQILTHILTSEKLSLGYMKKKVNAIDQLKDSGISESFRLWVLIASQRIPIKYKAPKVVVENTPAAMSLDQLTHEWDTTRKELATFLDCIEDKHVKRMIYKHPMAGRFDTRQTLIFFQEHIRHHQPQINRILQQPAA
ncbi:MAG: DinB family protein [Cyclobacteriaceae bacterium]|nr:DinB family protein [Cyclobacteriaceae bacterium]